jgi:hypothetical protein
MALVTQDEIINTMNVDDHLSVNNISNSTIIKAELYIANTFLGESFYNALESVKTSTGTFSNSNVQLLYDNYLLRLISEYVLTICLNDIILKVANKGIENTNQVDVYGVSKAAYQDEFERSKVMTDAYLIKNKANFSSYLSNDIDSTTDKIKPKTAYGFFIE